MLSVVSSSSSMLSSSTSCRGPMQWFADRDRAVGAIQSDNEDDDDDMESLQRRVESLNVTAVRQTNTFHDQYAYNSGENESKDWLKQLASVMNTPTRIEDTNISLATQLQVMWNAFCRPLSTFEEQLGRYKMIFDITSTIVPKGDLLLRQRKFKARMFELEFFMYKSGMIVNNHGAVAGELKEQQTDDMVKNKQKVRQIIENIGVAYHVIALMVHGHKMSQSLDKTALPHVSEMLMVDMPDENACESYKPMHKLLVALLKETQWRNLRRHKEDLMKPVMSPDGQFTGAYEKYMSIDDFPHSVFDRSTKHAYWQMLTLRGNAQACAKHLKSCRDKCLPDLKRNQSWWSFRHGWYDGLTDTYTRYGGGAGLPKHQATARYLDYDFANAEYNDEMQAGWERAQYKDTNRKDLPKWFFLETPIMDKILITQQWGKERSWEKKPGSPERTREQEMQQADQVHMWWYIMMGKLLFPNGVYDNWQKQQTCLGNAGSGKSTGIQMVSQVYLPGDVGEMANNVEKSFGPSQWEKCFFIAASDVKEDLNLDQGNWQKMVSAEAYSMAVKNKSPVTGPAWRVSQIWACNVMPGFTDNSDSVARRMMVFGFDFSPKERDPKMLENWIKFELPKFLKKACCAYMWATKRYASKDITKFLPAYFDKTKDAVQADTQPLIAFLKNQSRCVMPTGDEQHDRFCPINDFRKEFFTFCDDFNVKRPKWAKAFYGRALQSQDIEIRILTAPFTWLGKEYRAGTQFLVGVSLASSIAKAVSCSQVDYEPQFNFAAASAAANAPSSASSSSSSSSSSPSSSSSSSS